MVLSGLAGGTVVLFWAGVKEEREYSLSSRAAKKNCRLRAVCVCGGGEDKFCTQHRSTQIHFFAFRPQTQAEHRETPEHRDVRRARGRACTPPQTT